MRRMYSENQLIALIQQYAQGGGDLSVFAPAYSDESTYAKGDIVSKDDKFYQAKADIGTAEEWNVEHWNEVTFEEALKPYLNGEYVRKIVPPSSTTLTDEQINVFREGVFIQGNFLGLNNPIIMGLTDNSPYGLVGLIFSMKTKAWVMQSFSISNQNVISLHAKHLEYKYSSNELAIFKGTNGTLSLMGKNLPSYPSDTGTFTLKCVEGTLTWVQDD